MILGLRYLRLQYARGDIAAMSPDFPLNVTYPPVPGSLPESLPGRYEEGESGPEPLPSLLFQPDGLGGSLGQEILHHPDFCFVRPCGEGDAASVGMETQVA